MFLVIKHAVFTVSMCIFIFHMLNLLISDVDRTWIWNLISFIYCALIIIVRYPQKMFTHAGSDIPQYLNITSTFLNAVCVICLWYSLKYIQVLMINILMYIGYSTCTCFFSGKYQSASVINSLKDLLRNEDSNIRAVAAVSLAKTGNQDKSTINVLLKCLNDKDRLVRESGCLALGHMKAKRAVPKLLHLW